MPSSSSDLSQPRSWYKLETNRKSTTINADVWLAIFIGLAIFCYLIPWHAPVGRDFLANALSFVCIGFGLSGYFALAKLKKVTLSVFTWILLAFILFIQPFIVYIRYPDALIFPIASLLVAGLLAIAGSNIVDRSKFLKYIFIPIYAVCISTVAIQIMQIFDTNIMLGYLEITLKSENGRLYANTMQPNHTAYILILGLCGVFYHLYLEGKNQHNTSNRSAWSRVYKVCLLLMLIAFVMGIALTESRAGLVMMLCIPVIFFFSQPNTIKRKFILCGVSILGLFILHGISSWVYSNFFAISTSESLGAVSRMASEGLGNRLSLSQRGLMMFQDNPILGVGWNNYMEASLAYAADFNWPEIADHSHNVITMILAELGIVGLLSLVPLVWVLIRAIHFKHSSHSAVVLTFVGITVIYMMVEFPLWYFKYLAIFALFVGLIDQHYFKLPSFVDSKALKYCTSIILVLMSFIAEYYVWEFSKRDYLNYLNFYFLNTSTSEENKLKSGDEVFGFTNYHEMIMATQTPVDAEDNEFKKQLFKNAIGSFSSQYYLKAYAKILAYGNEEDQALYYFKTSCMMGKTRAGGCDDIGADLKELSKQQPSVFKSIYNDYELWRHNNPDKTGALINTTTDTSKINK